jgi:hypothetical protein
MPTHEQAHLRTFHVRLAAYTEAVRETCRAAESGDRERFDDAAEHEAAMRRRLIDWGEWHANPRGIFQRVRPRSC